MTTFKRGQRVLYRRSVLCGRAPEFGIIVKAHTGDAAGWYVVRDEDRPGSRGGSEHAEMLSNASDGWLAREIDALRAEASDAIRQSNQDVVMRYKADALNDVADRLAA